MNFHALVARRTHIAFPLTILFAVAMAASQAVAKPIQTGAAQTGSACNDSPRSVQPLAKIFNTRDRNFQCLGVKVDGDAITALRIESHRLVATGDTILADHVKIDEFSVTQIASQHGAVLDGTKGHEAIIVQGRVPKGGGDLELVTSYLYNGLTGEYRSCRIKLDRRAESAGPAWRLVNQFDETVSRIVVRTRIVPVLGTIGIANLEGACTPT
jgi:hypothetical protein